MAKNVTVLADVNGVQREYNELKRKAHVGERIKLSGYVKEDHMGTDHPENDDILTVTEVDGDGDVWYVKERNFHGLISKDEYVVLEPTSTVIIDGVRYTEEKRKARVGEKVLYVWKKEPAQVYTVTGTREDGHVDVEDEYDDDACGLTYAAYHVLTPIDEPKAAEPTVINLALTVNVQPGVDVAQAVADAVKVEMAKFGAPKVGVHVGYKTQAPERPELPKSAQQVRDEIVERAKADVAELIAKSTFIYREDEWFNPNADEVTYVVNREKRAVVALISRKYSRKVWAVGIAKCAPGDVFNSHIGRAIALRRALGLDVPTEYTNAPQPTEARVGDVVKTKVELGGGWTATLTKRAPEHDDSPRYKNKLAFRHTHDFGWVGDSQFDIIDDSREEVSA